METFDEILKANETAEIENVQEVVRMESIEEIEVILPVDGIDDIQELHEMDIIDRIELIEEIDEIYANGGTEGNQVVRPNEEFMIMNTYEEDDGLVRILPTPLVIRAESNNILFGLTDKFSTRFPPELRCKLAVEEFDATMERVNKLMLDASSTTLRWWYCGCIFCCCTFGLSFCPTKFCANKTLFRLMCLLEDENDRIYRHLGLQWAISKGHPADPTDDEYILLIEFLPKATIYMPD